MRIIIAAAGTGGHINPGIAIANKIKKENPKAEILFIGTIRGLENDLVPRAGFDLKTIDSYGISRKISLENIKRLFKTFGSIKQAQEIIKEFKPDLIIGTGGYICISVCKAAKKENIPYILHESNAFPGVAVKMLSKDAKEVLVGFEDTKGRLPKARKVVVTGNPAKMKKIDVSISKKEIMLKELGLQIEKPVVLVFGGSQGAQSINTAITDIIVDGLNQDYQILWATGANQYDNVKGEFETKAKNVERLKNAKVLPYIYNMEEMMNLSDLVVCRSGAMTVTEISLLGKPAIFIPFPFAAENHQEFNARVLEQKGAAKLILDKNLNKDSLHKMINSLVNDNNKLDKMSIIAKKEEIKDVIDNIYKEIVKCLK